MGAGAHAQPARSILSPEVLPDRRVVFRLDAPKAEEAAVSADWMKSGSVERMSRDAAGIWTITLGPLEPGIYIYEFKVDGMSIADPVNPRVKLRARTSASLLEVPGAPAEIWEARDVPHGKVEVNFHRAATLDGAMREVWVYTPPGYERGSRRYPVLYLLHGNNDTPAGWTMVGRAHFTLDNLLAEKRARPMIVVMPFGHALPFAGPRQGNTEAFERYLLQEVAPLIEGKYRVARGQENRAIAGFSMGGEHALHIGLRHLDKFSAIGAMSPAVRRDFEERYSTPLSNAETTNRKLNLLWIACGKDDFLFQASSELAALLTRHGIEHTYLPTDGAHTYNVWRGYFAQFAPLLFK